MGAAVAKGLRVGPDSLWQRWSLLEFASAS